MALNRDFYNEIFVQEQKWSELINKGLLNSIYCNLELKPFYIKKRDEIEEVYVQNKNELLGYFLNIINKIIDKIEFFDEQYKSLKPVDIKPLKELFIINQMNNEKSIENNKRKTI